MTKKPKKKKGRMYEEWIERIEDGLRRKLTKAEKEEMKGWKN